jgi:hypothetical protein
LLKELIEKYQAKVEHEKEIRNPLNMPNVYDRMRSLDRQYVYENVINDLTKINVSK